MTDELVRMTATALWYAHRLDNCQPDVGIGPTLAMLIARVCCAAGVPIPAADLAKVEAAYQEMFSK
jgi:hypothetical protein